MALPAAISLPGEIAKGVVPNAAFSALVAYIVLGRGGAMVPVRAIAFDAGPQSAMIAFATILVARAAVRRAEPAGHRRSRTLPHAAMAGAAIGILCGALCMILLPAFSSPSWSVAGLVGFKAAYGATLGAVLTMPALWLAARDRAGRPARS